MNVKKVVEEALLNSEHLIRQGESEILEFKKSIGEWKEIIKTISAFANTKGGIILVGISNKGTASGVQIGKRTIEDLANKIKENTDPKIFPRILVRDIDGKNIILVKLRSVNPSLYLLLIEFTKELGNQLCG